MAAEPYFADTMTLTVSAPDSTDVPVGGLKNVTVMLSAEHIKLYTADSIERESVKKRELSIPVEAEIAKWDESFATWWMGVSGSTSSSVTDDTDVALFQIDGTLTNDQGTSLSVTVDDVYFEEFPVWDASEGEFVTMDISGEGRTISNLA